MKVPTMVKAVPDILAEIVESKRRSLPLRTPLLDRAAADSVAARRDFAAALAAPAIIAEIKKASPSRGILATDFDPAATARAYQQGGAAALSVLTDEPYFQGSLDDLAAARAATTLPVLRKDFTIDGVHVIEAAAHNADAILLIAAILTETELRNFRELAEQYHMAALVEVHDEDDLALAIASGARIIGVNNRNLHTFEVDLETSLRLAHQIPADTIRVAESGIHTAADVRRLRDAGYHAFLVGERLMTSPDPAAALRELLS
jgi:indole-3-glycerol phosphate synthase